MQLFPLTDLHSEHGKHYSTAQESWSLTTLSETPEASRTVPGNPEGAAAYLVLRHGAGQAAAAFVQRVEPGVTTDWGLAGRTSTGAAQAFSQGNAGQGRRKTLGGKPYSKLLTYQTANNTRQRIMFTA